MRENSGMKWARCSTLTESIWSTPVRARVREKVRMVGVAWRGSRNPCATNAMRRACARDICSLGTAPVWRAPSSSNAARCRVSS